MEPITFQISDWIQYHEIDENEIDVEIDKLSSSENEESEDIIIDNDKKFTKYKIRLFGRTAENKSVIANINNYFPFFYIKIPNELSEHKIYNLINYIKIKISNEKIIRGFKSFDIIKRKDLYGFTAYSDFKFVRLVFCNMKSYKSFEYWIKNNKISNSLISKYPIQLKLYESNIEPFLRCMHIQKLNACGWVQTENYKKYDNNYSHCDISIETDWLNLKPVDTNVIQKFIIASWDIECMSLSGNFPQAINPEDKKELDNLLKSISSDIKKQKLSEGQLYKLLYENTSLKKYLKKVKDFKFNHEGDPIIMIGTVFSYYGESEPFFKSIITLKGCEKIKGLEDVEIQSYENEEDVLISWSKLIREKDPDVLTGWNINGFDFQYLFDRAKKLKIVDKVSLLSKIKGEICEFKEKTLASSALGDNFLKFYEIGGRIIIDMMKERQRESKLDSYKLDFVSSTYIKEKLVLCEILEKKTIIYTNGIYGIKTDDYINITWDNGLNENKHDEKYKIINIEKINQEYIEDLIKIVYDYSNINLYEFKKPKTLYKLEINGVIPSEIFEEGNENMWHYVETFTTINSKLYFQVDGYKNKKTEIKTENNNKSWIDIEIKEIDAPIKGNKIFWAHVKDDISPKELFSLYRGSNSDRGIIAKYCIMDCVLVLKLIDKLQVLNNNIAMANVCNVPLNYIFMRGQGIKIFSLVAKKCRELGFLIPHISPNNKLKMNKTNFNNNENSYKNFKKIKKNNQDNFSDSDDSDESLSDEDKGYEGATVFPPIKGIHYEPIPVLDYASLYPRSMIYINISHECYVNNPAYDNLPNYDYQTVTYNNNDGTTKTCRFAKKKDNTSGVLCIILEELLKKRSETKKLMEKERANGNYFLSAIWDGLQLAYKVTANSLYGQVGAPTSQIYMKELAASTTATGRKMLEFSRDFIQGPFGDLINYAIHDKEKYYLLSKDIYKDTPVYKFLEPRVNRNSMDDFINYFYDKVNILLNNNYKVKPIVIYGDSVTGNTPIILLNESNSIEIKYIKNINKNWKDYREFKHDDKYLLNKQQNLITINNYKVWTDNGWANIHRVIRHKTYKKIYEIITYHGIVQVTEDHSLLDIDGNQIKPSDCTIGTKLMYNNNFKSDLKINEKKADKYIKYIIEKYNNYYFDYEGNFYFSFDYSNSDDALSLYCACRILGFYIKINLDKTFEKKIIITSYKNKPMDYDNFNKILEINDMGYMTDYVYDLETSIGHFQAGIGSIIVKNTDSVFFTPKIHDIVTKQVKTDRASLKVCIEIGKLAGDSICKILPEPEEQVYEKTLWPFIILTKKRYVGNLYEDDEIHFKQKSMGIVLKRRDNAKIVKIVVGGIVDYILNGKPGESNIIDRNKGAIEYTRTLLKKILRGEYPIDKYIVSKTLRANYADRTRIVHAVLADRIGQRDPGNKPESNDRIPYVYIIPKGKVTLQGNRVEDPKYVLANNLELDFLFYITNQIMKPAKQFLEHIANNPDKLFENYINKEINRRKKINSVSEYLGSEIKNIKNVKYNKSESSDSEDESILNKIKNKNSILLSDKKNNIGDKTINKIKLNKNINSLTISI